MEHAYHNWRTPPRYVLLLGDGTFDFKDYFGWGVENQVLQFPTFDSLSETLLKADGKGIVAAFSPSGESLDGPAHFYHRLLLAELLHGGHDTLGDAILAAQAKFADSGGYLELLSIYHLFGDPAMRLGGTP